MQREALSCEVLQRCPGWYFRSRQVAGAQGRVPGESSAMTLTNRDGPDSRASPSRAHLTRRTREPRGARAIIN